MIEINPKKDFLATKHAEVFAEYAKGESLPQAVLYALMQFVSESPPREGLENACRQDYEIQGAKRFASTLLNLCEPETEPKKTTTENANLSWQTVPLHRPPPPPPQPPGQTPIPPKRPPHPNKR